MYAEVIKDKGRPPLSPAEESVIDVELSRSFITWVEVDFLIAQKARSLARRHSLKPVDAVHLATAIRAGCDQFLAWDGDFRNGTVIESVTLEEPHLTGLPQQLPGIASP